MNTKTDKIKCYYATVEPKGRAERRYARLIADLKELPGRVDYAPDDIPMRAPKGAFNPPVVVDMAGLDRACSTAISNNTSINVSDMNSFTVIQMVFGPEVWPLLHRFNSEDTMSFWVTVEGTPFHLTGYPELDLCMFRSRGSHTIGKKEWSVLEISSGLTLASVESGSKMAVKNLTSQFLDPETMANVDGLCKLLEQGLEAPRLSPARYPEWESDGRYMIYNSDAEFEKAHGANTDQTLPASS